MPAADRAAIEVDGNDGTGKSTLARGLAALGVDVRDRGRMTRATDDDSIGPEAGVAYLMLDVPVDVSQERLRRAGKDLTERYHTLADLTHYRSRFLEIAPRFGARVIDASGAPEAILREALGCLFGPLRLGLPKGRLFEGVRGALAAAGYALECRDRDYSPRCPGLKPFILKPRALPQMIALELLDAGFCGRDVLLESGYDDRLEEVLDLGLARVKLVAASNRADILERPPPRPLVVATEYTALADRWLTRLGLAHIAIQTWGSTEAYVPEHADLILDVVETGRTLAANGLVALHDFGESTTVLVARRGLRSRPDFAALVRALDGAGRG